MGGNGTLRQCRLGRELRRLREEAGLNLEEATPQLDWSTSKLSRIETGRVYLENAVNAAHVHKEAEVRGYSLVVDRLRSEALSPPDSVALVERLVDEL